MKTESVKNRTVCSNLYSNHTSATPKILKNRKTWVICISITYKKRRSKSHSSEFSKFLDWAQKFLLLHRIKSTIINYPKGFTWYFIETKAIKHDYYSSLIMWTHKTVGKSVGLSPNKRFSLMPFKLGMMMTMKLT